MAKTQKKSATKTGRAGVGGSAVKRGPKKASTAGARYLSKGFIDSFSESSVGDKAFDTYSRIGIKANKVDAPEEAIEIASSYITSLLRLKHEPTLEEIEIRDKYWYVTFSIPDIERGNIHLLPLMPRKYKILKIEASTGKLISMSIQDAKR